jgi:hypothetical protein
MSFQRKRSYLCAFLVDRQNKNNQSKETKSTKTYEKDPQKTPKRPKKQTMSYFKPEMFQYLMKEQNEEMFNLYTGLSINSTFLYVKIKIKCNLFYLQI